MDETDRKVHSFQKLLRKLLLSAVVLLMLLGAAGFALYRFTDLSFYLLPPLHTSYQFRTNEKSLQQLMGGKWEEFIIRGAELDETQTEEDYDTYLHWLTLLREMNANAVSVHCLMPPAFYQALSDLNREGNPLYLIQGIELSQQCLGQMTDMVSGQLVQKFRTQSRLILDAIHGNKHALGYRVDVSELVCMYVVGRQWDPGLILYTDELYGQALPQAAVSSGSYVSAWSNANASTHFIAQVMDDVFHYETRKYAQQHPVGIGNTQNTDPLYHSSSWDVGGRENIARVQTGSLSSSVRVKTGILAAYQIETGTMQCLSFDPDYAEYREVSGQLNPVQGYMTALNEHHYYMPVLLYEANMSAARGASGIDEVLEFHRGGIGEERQAEGLEWMFRSALNAGFIGGIVGQVTDAPKASAGNTPEAIHSGQWLDVQDSESCLGLVALEPDSPFCPDGDTGEWADVPPTIQGDGVVLKTAMDAAYLHLYLHIDSYNRNTDFLYLPFDITPLSGAFRDEVQQLDFQLGADFLLAINGTRRAKLSVQEYYAIPETYYCPEANQMWYANQSLPDGQTFVDLQQYLRRALFPEGDKAIPASFEDAGLLLHGNANPESAQYSSLACYCINGGEIELRIPWALLHFADPSAGQILNDFYAEGLGTISISDFQLGLILFSDGKIKDFGIAKVDLREYNGAMRERIRPAYAALQTLFSGLN